MKSVFIHIPKTGGTSLRVAIESADAQAVLVAHSEENVFHLPYQSYDREALLVGHLSWAMCDLFGLTERITLLREPVERCVSQVQHWMSMNDTPIETDDRGRPRRVVVADRPLAWNVENVLDRTDVPQYRALSNAMTAQLAHHQYERPMQLDGSWLERALRNMQECDLVGTTDRLAAFTATLSERLGLALTLGRERAGNTPAKELANSLPRHVVAKLRRHNELDLELFARFAEIADGDGLLHGTRLGARPPAHARRPSSVRQDEMELVALPGRFRLRFCQFLHDICELQAFAGVTGDVYLQRPSLRREATLASRLLSPGERLWTSGPVLDPEAAFGVADLGPAAHVMDGRAVGHVAGVLAHGERGAAGQAVIRLAMIQMMSDPYEIETALALILPRLCSGAAVILVDATMLSAAPIPNSLPAPFAVVDTHAVIATGGMGWLYGALLRAKFVGLEIIRTRHDDADLLTVQADF